MKKRYTLSFLVVCLSMMFVISCDRDLPVNLRYTHYDFSSLDPNGGSWSTVLLDAPDQIAIPEPADVNSAEYQAELADLKDVVANLGPGQRNAVEYRTNDPS